MSTNGLPEMTPLLAARLGSILVHLEEAIGPGRHRFDLDAATALLADPAVQEWLAALRVLGLLPVKRGDGR